MQHALWIIQLIDTWIVVMKIRIVHPQLCYMHLTWRKLKQEF